MTFLFISLLFLRPGLETSLPGNASCQRVASELNRQHKLTKNLKESVKVLNDVPIYSCDEGYPRLPIGDSHELFTLRLCYMGLLVQSLLSWQPPLEPCSDNSVYIQDAHAMLWMNEKVCSAISDISIHVFSYFPC